MNWGQMQRECHRMIEECFPSKKEGYKWLRETFDIEHFSQIQYKDPILREIYNKLYIKSFEE